MVVFRVSQEPDGSFCTIVYGGGKRGLPRVTITVSGIEIYELIARGNLVIFRKRRTPAKCPKRQIAAKPGIKHACLYHVYQTCNTIENCYDLNSLALNNDNNIVNQLTLLISEQCQAPLLNGASEHGASL